MIRYALKCSNDHGFESWFASANAFDALVDAGMVSCLHCGSTEVTKSLMTPAVRPARKAVQQSQPDPSTAAPATDAAAKAERPATAARDPAGSDLTHPRDAREKTLAALRRYVEANSEYVGDGFVDEARAIHHGEARARAIYGEAKPEQARELIEEGVPVAPLPFVPLRKTN